MKKLIVLLVAFLMLIFCNATASQAITLGFDPDFQGVLVGNQADVDLVISGLGDGVAPSLGAYDLDILFDPTILSFSNIFFGNGLDVHGLGLNLQGAIVNSPGVLDIFDLSWDSEDDLNSQQPHSFVLATLTFNTLTVGTSSLDIDASDPFFFLDGAGGENLIDRYTVDLQSGSINVVPEPATMLLLGSGLAGLGFLKKKNQVS